MSKKKYDREPDKWITIKGNPVPIFNKINAEIEIDDSEFEDEDDKNTDSKKPERKIKYSMHFGKDGFDIEHRHYEDDSSEYDIYEDGEYVDTAESMEDLRYLIKKWRKKKGKGDNNGKG